MTKQLPLPRIEGIPIEPLPADKRPKAKRRAPGPDDLRLALVLYDRFATAWALCRLMRSIARWAVGGRLPGQRGKGGPQRREPFPRRPMTVIDGVSWVTKTKTTPSGPVHGRGCDSGPGMCIVFSCLENLSVDYTPKGGVRVPETVGRCREVVIQKERSSSRNVKWSHGQRAIPGQGPETDDQQLAFALMTRTIYLVRRWGSNCVRDFRDLEQWEVADMLGLTRQRIQQNESDAMRKLKRNARARAILGEYAEEPRAAGFVPLMQIRRKG